MDFENIVYNSLSYLKDSGFDIKIIPDANYFGLVGSIGVIKIYKNEFFIWKDVCDELEPLLCLLYNKGLLDHIIIYDILGDFDHIIYFKEKMSFDECLNMIYENIGDMLYITIYYQV